MAEQASVNGTTPSAAQTDYLSDGLGAPVRNSYQGLAFVPVVTAVAFVTMAWAPPPVQGISQGQEYQRSYSTDPTPTTLGTLPTLAGQSLTPVEAKSLSLDYNQDNVQASPSANFVSPFTIASWQSTDGKKKVELRYERGNYVAQVSPTLATLPTFTAWDPTERHATTPPGPLLVTDGDTLTEPPTAQFVSPFTLSSWRQPDPLPLYRGRYEPGAIISQVAPTLATLATYPEWTPAGRRVSILGPLQYIDGDTLTEPPTAPFVSPFTQSSWRQPDPLPLYRGQYQPGGVIAQVGPTLATLATYPEWTPTDRRVAVPPQYLDADTLTEPVFSPTATAVVLSSPDPLPLYRGQYQPGGIVSQVAPTLATLPVTVTWTPTAERGQPQKFQPGSIINQVAPTLATLATYPDWTPLSSRVSIPGPLQYLDGDQLTEPVFAGVAAAVTFLPGWSSVATGRALPPDFNQDVFTEPATAPYVSPFTFSSWRQPDPLPFYRGQYQFGGIVSQVSPTLATLGTLLTLTPTEIKSLPPCFNQVEIARQIAPTLATLAFAPSFYTPREGQSLPPRYAQIELARQIQPTLATLATFVTWTPTMLRGLPPTYGSDVVTQGPTAQLVSPFTINSWLPTLGVTTFGRYAQIEIARQVQPTLATLASAPFYSPVELKGLPPIYWQPGPWSGPDKFNIVSPAITFLTEWSPTLGVNAQPQRYAQPFWSAPDRMVAAILTYDSWTPTLGVKSQPPIFALPSSWLAPDKMSAAILTLDSFLPTIGRNANPPTCWPTNPFTAPDKYNIVAPAITFLPGWSATAGVGAQPQRFDISRSTAPEKMSAAEIITFANWWYRGPLPTISLGYAQGYNLETGFEEFLIPRAEPVVQGQALPPRFSAAITAAPEKDLTVTFTLPGLLSTDGKKSQPQKFAPVTWSAPDKMSAAVLTLPSFTPVAQGQALPPHFAPTTWTAPDKVFPISIFSWTANFGPHAQPQKYEPSRWERPAIFTPQPPPPPFTLSAFLPTIGPKAQPQRYYDSTISNPYLPPFLFFPMVALDARAYPNLVSLSASTNVALVTMGSVVPNLVSKGASVIFAIVTLDGKVVLL